MPRQLKMHGGVGKGYEMDGFEFGMVVVSLTVIIFGGITYACLGKRR